MYLYIYIYIYLYIYVFMRLYTCISMYIYMCIPTTMCGFGLGGILVLTPRAEDVLLLHLRR